VEEELYGDCEVYGHVSPQSVETPAGGQPDAELDETAAEADEQGRPEA